MWAAYVVQCADGSLYAGASSDVGRRVRQHNAGRGARYTRSRAPVHLLAHVWCESKGDALSVERAFKRLPRDSKFLALAKLREFADGVLREKRARTVNVRRRRSWPPRAAS